MKIYERLKFLRKEQGLLQKNIADFLNISKSAYGYYEQGRNEPDIHTIVKLADFYQVSTDYLIGKTDVKQADLTKKESDIIKMYRNLNKDDQNIIFGAVYALSSKEKFADD